MMIRNEVPTLAYEETSGREARIARDRDGAAIGAAIFFTPDDLAGLGIDPATADVVELRIVNGQARLQPVESANKPV